MTPMSRRIFLQAGVAAAAASVLTPRIHAEDPPKSLLTPAEIEGPFYPIVAQKDVDFDLTRIEGQEGTALGTVIQIQGHVRDTTGKSLPDATVDLWQANAAGRYHHPHDSNPAPLDPNFQGWAIVQSGQQSRFQFTTILPGAYPVSDKWSRPPHIHFKVSKRGYEELVTQMYFADQPLNDRDRLLLRHPESQRSAMIASSVSAASDETPAVYAYDIVLAELD